MNKRAQKKHVQRAATPISTATSGPVVTIPLSVWQQMYQTMAPQKSQAETFSPGAPLQPIPGITPAAGPRQWSYMPGFNLAGNDRTLQRDYIPPFQQLRMLAQTYNAIGTAERIWCDLIPRMQLQVTLTDDLKAHGKDDKDYQKEISGYLTFFETPDGQDDIHEWLRKSIVEQTQIDALVMFKRKNRGGKLQGLDLLDGSDIKPLLDERGRVPSPPYAAYQQYSYGTPGEAYTTNDMIYYRESPRTFTPYGFSRVERIITIVNIALRKQQKDLLRFTEGNIPAGMMEVPDASGWTPDQIETFSQMWNSYLAGNTQQQVRIQFLQPGMKYTAFDQPEAQLHLTEFDTFLTNVTAGVYGVSLADFAMTGDIHKSADDGQQNMLYRRTIEPLAIAYGRMLTRILREDFGDPRFVVKFTGYDEKEDVQTQVAALSEGIQNAMISPADAAAKLGWPDVPKTGPLFITKGGITPLASFEIGSESRKASDAAQLAGFQLAAQGDPNAQDGQEDEEAPANDKTAPAGKPKQDANAPGNGQKEDEETPTSRVTEMIQKADEILSLIRARNVTPAWAEEEDEFVARHDPGKHNQKTHGSWAHKAKATAHHKGKGVNVEKVEDVLSTRATRAAARFAKLAARKLSKTWTVAQQQAAQQTSDLFTKLADGFEDGKGETAEHLMKQILEQGAIIYGANSKQYVSLQKMMDSFDKRMDKIGIDRMDIADEFEDEEEDTWIDEEIDEQRTPQNAEELSQRTGERTPARAIIQADVSARTASIPEINHSHDGTEQSAAFVRPFPAEIHRWRQRAISDIRSAGKVLPRNIQYSSSVIPDHIRLSASSKLQSCTTVDDVVAVFERVEERDTSPKAEAALNNGGHPQPIRRDWRLRW